jgi:alpha-tubulin suppressor-like RCC1 family protein
MSGYGTLGSVPNGYSVTTAINYLNPTTCSLSLPSYRPVEMWRSSYNTYVLDSLGNLHAAGSNLVNQLGLGKAFDSLAYSSKLDKITFTTNLSTQIIKFASTPVPTAVTTGDSSQNIHCIALATDGTIYTWGLNTNGECGLNNLSVVFSPSAVNYTQQYCAGSTKAISAYPAFNYKANSGTITTPSLMFKDVYAGSIISFVLKNDGTAYGAGWNGSGGLANGMVIGNTNQTTFAPVLSGLYDKMLYGINRIYIADNGNIGGSPQATTYFLLNDGSLWASGNGASGELGLGTTIKSLNYASKITLPDASPVTLFQAYYYQISKGSAIAYTSANHLYSWGYNDNGQLGNGTSSTTGQFLPASVVFTVTEGYTAGNPLNDCTVVEIIMCSSLSGLLLSDGSVWTAGDNTNNQGAAGQSSTVGDVKSFTKVRLPYNEKAARISFNGRGYKDSWTLVIVTQSGKVYGCGTNGNGELGLGNTNGYYYLPTRIYNI